MDEVNHAQGVTPAQGSATGPRSDRWWYARGSDRQGPLPRLALEGLLANGDLPGRTLVWADHLAAWTPASQLEEFRAAITAMESTPRAAWSPTQKAWLRFLGRTVDGTLWGALFEMFSMSVMRTNPTMSMALFVFGFALVTGATWYFLEAYLLSAFGTTPGKALVGIGIRERGTDDPPQWGAALRRSFLVLLRGQGLGIPLASLIANVMAYSHVSSGRTASWDTRTGTEVRFRRIGAGRIALAIAVVVVASFAPQFLRLVL